MRRLSKCFLIALLFITVGLFSVKVEAATAVEKEINTSFSGSLEQNYSENWYKLTTGENTYMVINFSSEEVAYNGWNVSVYNDSYKLIRTYANVNSNLISDRFMLGDDTTFYIKVDGWNKDRTPKGVKYTISTKETTDKLFEKESNNAIRKANVLSSGKAKYGTIWTENDLDYYEFTTTKSGYTQIEFHSESDTIINCGWNLIILDAEYNVISKETGITDNYKSIKLNFKKGTTFYVLVEAYNNDRAPIDKLYSVTAKEKKTTSYEAESNNTVKKATVLKKKKYGTIYLKNDIDYYKYNAKATKNVTVKFTLEDDVIINFGWKVSVYDTTVSDKTCVAKEDQVKNDIVLKYKAQKGHTYYIVVEAYNNDRAPINVTYMVSVS